MCTIEYRKGWVQYCKEEERISQIFIENLNDLDFETQIIPLKERICQQLTETEAQGSRGSWEGVQVQREKKTPLGAILKVRLYIPQHPHLQVRLTTDGKGLFFCSYSLNAAVWQLFIEHLYWRGVIITQRSFRGPTRDLCRFCANTTALHVSDLSTSEGSGTHPLWIREVPAFIFEELEVCNIFEK